MVERIASFQVLIELLIQRLNSKNKKNMLPIHRLYSLPASTLCGSFNPVLIKWLILCRIILQPFHKVLTRFILLALLYFGMYVCF